MWYNAIITSLLNSPLHGLLSGSMMVITYKGRKSGKIYHTPVNYVRVINPQGEIRLLTTSFRKRTWWRNLRNGTTVTLRLAGKDQTAMAEVIEDNAAVATELETFLNAVPNLAKYFGVSRNAEDRLNPEEIQHAAQERVIIKCRT